MRALRPTLAVLALSGCASIERYEGVIPKPDETVVHAYHVVRSANASKAVAGGMVFCAKQTGVEAIRAEGRAADQSADKIDDYAVQEHVRSAIDSDPALRDEPIHAKIVQGEAFLYGKLSSEQHATLAVYDALQVVGVGLVNAAFVTPESPKPMDVRAIGACY